MGSVATSPMRLTMPQTRRDVADGLARTAASPRWSIMALGFGFKQIASAELLSEGATGDDGIASRVGGRNQNWAPMALADGKLLIRDQTQLKCVKVAQ